MTIDEKIGQILMIDFNSRFLNDETYAYKRINEAVERYYVGGFVVIGGSTYSSAIHIKQLQKKSKYPLLFASDFERGVFQQLPDGTSFPPNMAIAATRNTDFAYKQGLITAKEAKSLGFQVTFSPVLDINSNPDNPIINYRSYGDSPELVADFGSAMIRGLQENGLFATAKHFPGHGNTSTDSHSQLPVIDSDIDDLENLELIPFQRAIENNVRLVMTGHIATPRITEGKEIPATRSAKLIKEILREDLDFSGIVISDAMNMSAISPRGLSARGLIDSFNSGVDILLMPLNLHFAFNTLKEAVESNLITLKRLDKSVHRILSMKEEVGLFEKTDEPLEKIKSQLEKSEYAKLSNEIAQKSITLLRQSKINLPLDKSKKLLTICVSSEPSFENPGKTFASRLKRYYPEMEREIIDHRSNFEDIKRIKENINNFDYVVIALFSRTSSVAETVGIQTKENDAVKEVIESYSNRSLAVSFGSPYIASDFNYIEDHLTAYAYSRLMQRTAADAIGGLFRVSGKTPVKIPKINETYQYYPQISQDKGKQLLSENSIERIDSLMEKSVEDSIFPGSSIIIGNSRSIFYKQGYGRFTYDKISKEVTAETRFDLASLTKVFATSLSIMKLIDQYQLRLDNTLSDLFPEYLKSPEKKDITIANLLTHTSGQVAYKHYFETVKNKVGIYKTIFDEPLIYKPGEKTVYSDLGFILLMRVIETISGKSLDQYVKDNFYDPMRLTSTSFLPTNKMQIPPTEAVEWRGYLAQGEVHDENAMSIGGVSGHAGLFSNVSDLAAISQMMLNMGVYNGKRYLSAKGIGLFTSKAGIDSISDRGFGWDKPSPISSAGKYISDQSFGHYGFTGTTVWIDPKNDVFIIHLSNRVYPSRKNIKIRKFRRVFYNLVMESLGKTELRESYKVAIKKKKN